MSQHSNQRNDQSKIELSNQRSRMKGIGRFVVRCIGLCFMAGIAFSFAYWQGGVAAMFIAGGFGVIMLHALLIYVASFGHYDIRVVSDQSDYVAGDVAVVKLELAHRRGLPLFWLVIEQEWVNETRMRRHTYRQLVVPLFRRALKMTYKINALQRGVYRCSHMKLYTGDVFGLFVREKVVVMEHARASFVVYPEPLTIDPQISNEFYGSVMSRRPAWQDTQQFSSIRDYATGDPLNRIHWKSSARLNELKTRENERRQDRKLLIMLDASRASYIKQQPISSFEKCVQVAASFMHYAQQHALDAELVCSDRLRSSVAASALALEQANAALSRVRADGEVPFSHIVRQEGERVAENTLLLCVTSQLDDPLYDTLYRLRTQHIRVGLLLIYSTATLAWHEQYLKERLQALDCLFYSVQHTQLERQPSSSEVMSDVS